MLALVSAFGCIVATRRQLAARLGMTAKQLRRATEDLCRRGLVKLVLTGRRFGGRTRAVCAPDWDPNADHHADLAKRGLAPPQV